MKRVITSIIVLFVLFGISVTGGVAGNSSAENQPGTHLICDPALVDQGDGAEITHYELSTNGQITRHEPTQVNATHVKIRHEITDLPAGDYTFKARWVDERYGHVGPWSDTVTATVPADDSLPACNIRLEVN
jgi:hypothetical protein